MLQVLGTNNMCCLDRRHHLKLLQISLIHHQSRKVTYVHPGASISHGQWGEFSAIAAALDMKGAFLNGTKTKYVSEQWVLILFPKWLSVSNQSSLTNSDWDRLWEHQQLSHFLHPDVYCEMKVTVKLENIFFSSLNPGVVQDCVGQQFNSLTTAPSPTWLPRLQHILPSFKPSPQSLELRTNWIGF